MENRYSENKRLILEQITNLELSKEEGKEKLEELMIREKLGTDIACYTKFTREKKFENDTPINHLGHFLVIVETPHVAKKLFSAMQTVYSSLTIVSNGEGYKKIEEGFYEIGLNQLENYQKLFADLDASQRYPSSILHMLSDERMDKKKSIESGLFSMFYLSKALSQVKKKVNQNIVFQYNTGNAMNEAVEGFTKSVYLENRNLNFKTISIDLLRKDFDSSIAENIVREFSITKNENKHIYYDSNKRYIKMYKKVDLSKKKKNQNNIVYGGTYLITGGLGALGYSVAKYLVKKWNANLILTGRTKNNTEIKSKLKKLETIDNKVIYSNKDVGNIDEMEILKKEISNHFDNIDGIIHCAGNHNDAFLINKEKSEIRSVIDSKVLGVNNLYETFKKSELRFFVLFSSISAVFGNIGQSDYSFANSYMDHYANNSDRNSLNIISINWPLWESGGMETTTQNQKYLEENIGIKNLETKLGMMTLETLLNRDMKNPIIFSGDVKKIDQVIQKINNEENFINDVSNNKLHKGVVDMEKIDLNILKEQTNKYLGNIFIEITKIPKGVLGPDDSFEKIGFDSIMAMNVNSELEVVFGEITQTLLFEYPTINELSEYFIDSHLNVLVELFESEEVIKSNVKLEKRNPQIRNKEKKSIFTKKGIGNNKNRKSEKGKDIAIIGVSGKFPMSNNLEEFWKNLVAGKDCIDEIPSERWDIEKYYTTSKNELGKMYCKWGGFLDDVDKFDALFFNISPREAEIMDPQERLFLQCSYSTIEDAGYTKKSLDHDKVGVFVGVMYGQYQLLDAEVEGKKIALSSVYASIANRVSYHLNLNGPSIALDTMCSSSLTSIHLACDSIRNGESNYAIAGGVNISIHPDKYIFLSQQKFAASDGRCRSFGEGGDGYVPGEGVGAVLLKSLDQAIEDGDNIYAVIKSSAINHGGKTTGYTVPNPSMQSSVICDALDRGNINPRTINYIEAHGTGTSLGDPIEVSGLVKAFKKHTKDTQFCAIGSVKSNVGHCESAAGIAAITKVILQMKYKKLVPSIHSEVLNKNIDFESTPFFVQRELSDWNNVVLKEGKKEKTYPRRAGVSSFGAGGANAHIILEEYIDKQMDKERVDKTNLFVLSARSEERLRNHAQQMLNHLSQVDNETDAFENIVYTLQVGRESFTERVAIVASSTKDIKEQLNNYLDGIKNSQIIFEGSSKKKSEYAGIMDGGSATDEFTSILIREKNYEKIAQLWVLGIEIDWEKLYLNYNCKKISLPSYPFEKKRHWIDNASSNKRISEDRNQHLRSIDGIVEYNLSNLEIFKFMSTNSHLNKYVEPYKIDGIKYLNSFGLLIFAKYVIEQVGYGNAVSMENINWKGMTLEDDKMKIEANIVYKENTPVCRLLEESSGTIFECVIGKVTEVTEKESNLISRNFNEQSSKQAMNLHKQNLACYGIENGVDYLTDIYNDSASETVVYRLIFDEEKYLTSVEVLEIIFNTLIGFVGKSSEGNILIPYSMTKMVFKYIKVNDLVIHIRSTADNMIEEVYSFDMDILMNSGEIIGEVKEVQFRNMESLKEDVEKEQVSFFKSKWYEKDFPAKDKHLKDILVFSKAKRSFKNIMDLENQRIIEITDSKDYQCDSNGNYRMNFEHKESYIKLFEDMKQQGVVISHIAFISDDVDELESKLNFSIFAILKLTQALMVTKVASVVNLVYIFNASGDYLNNFDSAMNGFMRTLSLESPNYKFKTVGIEDTLNDDNCSKVILSELLSEAEGAKEIVYKDGKRLTKTLEAIDFNITKEIQLRKNGVYIIIGGTGGLGRIFAKYLKTTYNATLILTGRKLINERINNIIKEVSSDAKNIEYVSSNASHFTDTEELIKKVLASYGRISGIINCVGFNNDNFIMNKTQDDFDKMIASKVMSSINIDKATKDIKMDFIVFFSSIAGETGNLGQSDYAYVNSYINYFVQQRERLVQIGDRKSRGISIAWPLWDSEGMSLSKEEREILEIQTGLTQLSEKKGLEAFETILSSDDNFVIVGNGKQQGVSAFIDKVNNIVVHEDEFIDELNDIDFEELKQRTIDYLIEVFSELLKMDKEEIDTFATFEEYGIESVMVGYFNGKLEEDLGSLSKTLLFEYQTIDELGEFLHKNHKVSLIKHFGMTGDIFAKTEGNHSPEKGVKSLTWEDGHIQDIVQFKTNNTSNSDENNGDVAIIGVSGKYPMAKDIYEYWENIKTEKDCIVEIPKNRWDYKDYYDPDYANINDGKMYSKWGGFIDDVDMFDTSFFKISPREAIIMDPQERLFVETAWSALEDSGYSKNRLRSKYDNGYGANVGVFVGATTYSYQLWGPEEWVKGNTKAMPNVSPWSIANRVSYIMNFSGPSMPIDTACSSSLTAIHVACESLKNKECKVAIAGGVNLYLHPYKYVLMCQTRMLSPTGKCHSFSENADGFVPGEGVGAIILKPLQEAINDNDYIYGVVKATDVNHGGRANGYTVPNPNAQANLISSALKKAGVDSDEISYIEAHGTGTKLGDPIEIAALDKAFGDKVRNKTCAIGSVKSNIGHLEAAAGIASVTKVLLQFKNKQLTASINAKELNTNIDFDNSKFHYQRKLEHWEPSVVNGVVKKRLAGIGSYGAGGSNAYVILEEYDVSTVVSSNSSDQIIVVSGKDDVALRNNVVNLYKYLISEESKEYTLENIAYTLQVGREHLASRLALICTSVKHLKQSIKAFIDDERGKSLYRGSKVRSKNSFVDDLTDDNNICVQWIDGYKVDWENRHNHNECQTLPLPTYAFARESYWIEKKDSYNEVFRLEKKESLVVNNVSTFNEQRFEAILNKNMGILDKVKGKNCTYMPVLLLAEIFMKASKMSTEKDFVELGQLIFGKKILFENDLKVITTLYEGDTNIECEASYTDDTGVVCICAQGLAMVREEEYEEIIDINKLFKDGSNELDGVERDDLWKSANVGILTLKNTNQQSMPKLIEKSIKKFAGIFEFSIDTSIHKIQNIIWNTQNFDNCKSICKIEEQNDQRIILHLIFVDVHSGRVLLRLQGVELRIQKDSTERK